MMTSTWRLWLDRLSRPRPQGRRWSTTRPPRRHRPHLERLEDRTLPSVTIAPPNNNGNGYLGTHFSQTQGYVPPDTCGAAGPNTYVETVNQTVSLYHPAVDAATSTSSTFSNFWYTVGGLPKTDSGSFLSDPIVVYDDQIGRFIVGDQDVDFSTHVSNFDIAVSKSSNPATLTTADWNFYQISTTEAGFDADYPGNFGYNHDAFVYTLNMFPAGSGNFHVQIDSVNVSDLANGVPPGSLHSYHNDNFSAASLRPTVMHDSAAGDPMWLVQESFNTANAIDVIKMSNVLSNAATFTTTTLPVTPYSDIGNTPPKNPNGTVITNNIDSRIQKAAEWNHTIVASHGVSVGATQDDAQWYKIDVSSGTPTLADQGRVGYGANTYVYYPTVDINAQGQIGMTFMKSGTDSPTDYMSMYVTARLPSDAAGTMETPVIVPAGTGVANYKDFTTGGRAGDLSGINVDPNDGSFWAANEFANTDPTANWGTAIVQFWPGIRFGTTVQVTDVTPFTNTGDIPGQSGQVWLNSEVEPWISVDPNNPKHMLGGWQQDRWSNGGARGLVVGVTTDGGNTWTKVPIPNLTLTTGGNYKRASDVWTSIGPDGTAYAVSLAITDPTDNIDDAVLVSHSTDGGFTWSNPVVVTTNNNPNLFNDKESITADPTRPGYAYVVWDRLNSNNAIPTEGPGPALISRTTDGGLTWSAPTPLYDPTDGQTIANQLVVLPNGTLMDMGVHIVYATNATNIFVATSTDAGLTWSAPVNVSNFSNTGETDPNNGAGIRSGGIIPDVAVDRYTGHVYIVWEDSRFSGGAHDDIALSESSDGGQTWSTPIKVNQTPVNNSKPADEQAFTATVAVGANSTVAVAYYDFRNNTGTGGALTDRWIVFANPNGPTGLTFGNERRLTYTSFDMELAPNAGGYFVGDYEGMTNGGLSPDTFGDFWSGTVSATDPASIFFRGDIQPRELNLSLTSFTPPTGATEGTPVGGVLASFTDTVGNSVLTAFTAVVHWGDGTTDTETSANGGIIANVDGSYSVLDTHVYTEESTGLTFSMLITDGGGGFDTAPSAYLTVADAPLTGGVLTTPALAEGQSVSNFTVFQFTDTDPNAAAGDYTAVVTLGDGNTVTLTSAAGPNGQIVAVSGGTFDVQLTYTYAEEFLNHTFSVVVTDHNASISGSTSTFSVIDLPMTKGILTQPTATEGQPITNMVVYNFTDTDPNGTASDYTAVVTLGDGNTVTLTSTPTANGQIVPHAGGTFDVVLSYTYAEEVASGTFTVFVSDSPQVSLSSSIPYSVADAPLTAGAFTPPVATAGVPFTNVVIFHFTDADPAGTTGDYTAVVALGDGNTVTLTSTPSTNGQIVANGGGFDVQLSYTYNTSLSNATFSVTVTDHNATASASTNNFNVTGSTLSPGPLTPPSATEGAAFNNVVVFHYTDSVTGTTPSNYSAVVTLGDGNTVTLTGTPSSNGQIVANSGGGFDVQLSYTYAEELSGKTFSVRVTSNVNNNQTFATTTTFGVADAALTAGALTPPPSATEGQAFSNLVVFHFTDADPAGTASDYTAIVKPGDGTTLTLTGTASANGQIVANAGGFDVQLSHTYAEELTGATFSVTVTDAGGASAGTVSGSVNVADAGLTAGALTPPAATEGQALNNVTVFHFTDNDPAGTASDYTAVVVVGDGATVTLTSTPTANGRIVAHTGGGFDVQLSHTYAEELSGATFSVTVSDAGGASLGTVSGTLNVADAGLTAGAFTPPVAQVGVPFSNVVIFHYTDADPAGTASDYTAVVLPGDGTTVTLTSTPSSNGQIVANSGGGFDVQFSYTYNAPLSNVTFSVTVTDHNATASASTNTFSVPPSGGGVGQYFILLDATVSGALSTSNTAVVNFNGTISVNSNSPTAFSAQGSSKVTATQINVHGGASIGPGATVSPTPTVGAPVASDPFGLNQSLGYRGGSAVTVNGTQTVTINPGAYSQILVSGQGHLIMNPGLYIIGGQFNVSQGGLVTGSGVTIAGASIFTPGSGGQPLSITLSGNAVVNLSPATSGTFNGILIYEPKQDSNAIQIQTNAALQDSGNIYAPSARIILSGTAPVLTGGIVADALTVSGGGQTTLVASGGDATDESLGALQPQNLAVWVDNRNGLLTGAEQVRIADAISGMDRVLAPYHVSVHEVADAASANVVVRMLAYGPTGDLGAESPGLITLYTGWDWYAGANPGGIGAAQYDFQTVFTHELGHALGLGHSADPASPMYEQLTPGTAARQLRVADLGLPPATAPTATTTATGPSATAPAVALSVAVLPAAGISAPAATASTPGAAAVADIPTLEDGPAGTTRMAETALGQPLAILAAADVGALAPSEAILVRAVPPSDAADGLTGPGALVASADGTAGAGLGADGGTVGRLPGSGPVLPGGVWSETWSGADEPYRWEALGDSGPAAAAALDVVFRTLGEQGPEVLQDAVEAWTPDDTPDLTWTADW
jgi:hypothetical protein